ncbi:MAG: hypothetical protein ACTIJ6_01225 [Leucobacter sp.]
MASEIQQTVELRRTVRYGRLLIVGAIVGAAIASLVTLLFPIAEGAMYTMGQIAGFMLLIGGIIGLAIGGVIALVLTSVAKRNQGTGVVSQVTESDIEAAPVQETPENSQPTAE